MKSLYSRRQHTWNASHTHGRDSSDKRRRKWMSISLSFTAAESRSNCLLMKQNGSHLENDWSNQSGCNLIHFGAEMIRHSTGKRNPASCACMSGVSNFCCTNSRFQFRSCCQALSKCIIRQESGGTPIPKWVFGRKQKCPKRVIEIFNAEASPVINLNDSKRERGTIVWGHTTCSYSVKAHENTCPCSRPFDSLSVAQSRSKGSCFVRWCSVFHGTLQHASSCASSSVKKSRKRSFPSFSLFLENSDFLHTTKLKLVQSRFFVPYYLGIPRGEYRSASRVKFFPLEKSCCKQILLAPCKQAIRRNPLNSCKVCFWRALCSNTNAQVINVTSYIKIN